MCLIVACVCGVLDVVALICGSCKFVVERVSARLAAITGLSSPLLRMGWPRQRLSDAPCTSSQRDHTRESVLSEGSGRHEGRGTSTELEAHCRVRTDNMELRSRPISSDGTVGHGSRMVEQPILVFEGKFVELMKPRAVVRANVKRSKSIVVERAERADAVVGARWRELNESASNGHFYGVAIGRVPRIYPSWAQAYQQVYKVSGNSHQKFSELQHALMFIREHQLVVGLDEDIKLFGNNGVVVAVWRFPPNQCRNGRSM